MLLEFIAGIDKGIVAAIGGSLNRAVPPHAAVTFFAANQKASLAVPCRMMSLACWHLSSQCFSLLLLLAEISLQQAWMLFVLTILTAGTACSCCL